MPSFSIASAGRRPDDDCRALIIEGLASFSGEPRTDDLLLLVARDQARVSAFGQAVFLRDEIDAGTVSALFAIPPGSLAPLLSRLAGRNGLGLTVDSQFWTSGLPKGEHVSTGEYLIAVGPSSADDLWADAARKGLVLCLAGRFGDRPEAEDGRSAAPPADSVQAAFWARRLAWRQPLLA